MTGRQRMAAALSPAGTPQTPGVICYEGIYYRDHWEQVTSKPWWCAFSPELEDQLAWRAEAAATTGQDWLHLPACPSRADRAALRVEPRGDGAVLIDTRTSDERPLRRPAVGGWDADDIARRRTPPRLPETLDQIDAAVPVPPAFDAERFVADGRADLAAAILRSFGRDLYPIDYVGSPLWGCYGLWGFEGLMLLIADRADLVGRACRRLLAGGVRAVRQAAARGAAAIVIEECFTDMISPAAFEALNVPVVGGLIEAIRAAGMKSIYYYCGDPAGKWDAIAGLGADALAFEESKKGFVIDVADVVRRVGGRCAVMGNLDAIGVLERGTDAQLRAEIARQLTAGRANGGRFVMSLGSPVTPGTSPRRVRQYLALVRDLTDPLAAARG